MEEDGGVLNRQERGAALVVVLVALAVLLPLALVLSQLVLMRYRQVGVFREDLVGQTAVRGALDLAMARLRSRQIVLGLDETEPFEAGKPGTWPVHVRVSRQPDAVVTLDGRLLGPDRAFGLDLQRVGLDGEGRLVRQYRKLEVYLVEAESPARVAAPAVRLLAVVARLENGGVVCLGLRYDRGYFR